MKIFSPAFLAWSNCLPWSHTLNKYTSFGIESTVFLTVQNLWNISKQVLYLEKSIIKQLIKHFHYVWFNRYIDGKGIRENRYLMDFNWDEMAVGQ